MVNSNEGVEITRSHILCEVRANGDGTLRLTSQLDANISRLNPGLGNAFPWTYNLATNYEKYTIDYYELAYQPVTSMVSAGDVVWYIDFDCENEPPQTVNDMFQEKDVQATAVFNKAARVYSKNQVNSFLKEKLIDVNPVGPKDPLKDIGVLYVATSGYSSTAAVATVGFLWVKYRVKLKTPTNHPGPQALASSIVSNSLTNSLSFSDLWEGAKGGLNMVKQFLSTTSEYALLASTAIDLILGVDTQYTAAGPNPLVCVITDK